MILYTQHLLDHEQFISPRLGRRQEFLEHLNNYIASTPIDPPLQMLQKLPAFHSNTCRILDACFSRMEEHYWYSMMEEDRDKIYNTGIAIKQRYEHILSLFISVGYININNGIYNITPKYCENMKQHFIHICTLHFTSVHVRSGPRTWYICKITPLFKGTKQQEMTRINRLATHSTVVSNDAYDKKIEL